MAIKSVMMMFRNTGVIECVGLTQINDLIQSWLLCQLIIDTQKGAR